MRLPSFRGRDRDRIPSPFSSGGLLDEFFQDLEESFFGGSGLGRLGNTDIYQRDGEIHYEVELPGLKKEDIKIQVRGDRLIVSGELEEEEEKEDANYISRGRRYGTFRRTLPLPEELEETDQLKASFENGILHIRAPFSEPFEEEEVVDVEIE